MCKLLLLPPALLGLTRLQSLELQMNFMTTLPAVSVVSYLPSADCLMSTRYGLRHDTDGTDC
jgi:hypothetical protein